MPSAERNTKDGQTVWNTRNVAYFSDSAYYRCARVYLWNLDPNPTGEPDARVTSSREVAAPIARVTGSRGVAAGTPGTISFRVVGGLVRLFFYNV